MLRAERLRDNGELMARVDRQGYIQGRVLDATYGSGVFWNSVTPRRLVTMDARWLGMVRGDFTRPPFAPRSFGTVVLDPPYKLNGTPDQSEESSDYRYGVHNYTRWQSRVQLIREGVRHWVPCSNCHGSGLARIELPVSEGYPEGSSTLEICSACDMTGGMAHGLAELVANGGHLLVKCMDQVVSGAMRWQTDVVTTEATLAGLIKVERHDMLTTPRPQPGDREERHCQANYSTLLIFKRPGRRAKKGVEASAWTEQAA